MLFCCSTFQINNFAGIKWLNSLLKHSLLALCILFLLLSFTPLAEESKLQHNDLPLLDVLQLMNKRGAKIIYSSGQVHGGMRVSKEQVEQLLQTKAQLSFNLLAELLNPFQLSLKKGPQNNFIITKIKKKPEKANIYGVSGKIKDKNTDQVIGKAKLTLLKRDNHELKEIGSTRSTKLGKFSFEELLPKTYLLRVEAQGYLISETHISFQDAQRASSSLKNKQIKLYLEPESIERVVISASQYGISYSELSSEQFFDQKDIERMSHLTSDINRAVAHLPGVAGGGISAKLHIRGGTAQENSFLFDGMPLFDPFHFKAGGSFFSIIDTFTIGAAQIITGGAPVEFGDHLSGVINVTSNNWDQEKPWAIGINFLDVKAKASGSLGKNSDKNNNWLFSLRRGFLGAISATSTADLDDYKPEYVSGFGKVNFELSEDTLLTWHSLITQDFDTCIGRCFNGADGKSLTSYHWLTAKTQWLIGLSSTTLIGLGQLEDNRNGYGNDEGWREYNNDSSMDPYYKEDLINGYRYLTIDDQLDWRFQLLKQNWQYQVSSSQIIKAGFSVNLMEASYDYAFSLESYDLFKPTEWRLLKKAYQIELAPKSNHYSIYFSDLFKLNKAFTTEVGLRWDRQSYSQLSPSDALGGNKFSRSETQISPRINFDYRNLDGSNYKLSWGVYHQAQGIHELAKEQPVANAADLLNTTQKVTQTNFSYQNQLTDNLSYKVSLYNKRYHSVQPRYENLFGNNDYIYEAEYDRLLIAPQSAQASGFEIVLRQIEEKQFNWWLAYSLSKAEEMINGHTQARRWDQRHSLNLSASYQFSQNCNVNFMGNYHTGWRDTPVFLQQADPSQNSNQPQVALGQAYSEKYPNSIRVDMRIGCEKKLPNSRIRYFFEVLNLFGRDNISSLSDVELFYSEQGELQSIERVDDRGLPFIPSLGFIWEF